MSMCRTCRGKGWVGPSYGEADECERCLGAGAVCDQPRGPGEPITCSGPVVAGMGDYCEAHRRHAMTGRS